MNPETRFYRNITAELEKRRERQLGLLAEGMTGPLDEISLRYIREQSYLKALNDILALCDEVERAVFGE